MKAATIRSFQAKVREILRPYLLSNDVGLDVSSVGMIATKFGLSSVCLPSLTCEIGSSLYTVFLKMQDVSVVPENKIRDVNMNRYTGKWNFHLDGEHMTVHNAAESFRNWLERMEPIRQMEVEHAPA